MKDEFKIGSGPAFLPQHPNTFTITFGVEIKKTVHIPNEDLPKLADLLNEFLISKGINSYVQDYSDGK